MASPLGLGNNSTEIQRLSEELMAAKTKLASWEESWVQAYVGENYFLCRPFPILSCLIAIQPMERLQTISDS